ncbi:MAG: RNA polymerase sigma factor [Clostridia bacterium]|nr:RNA polymerase sigma factor [Clostridia bacterium]
MLQADFIQRVRACERRLYRVARTMLPQECDCEDAVQEALLRAWDRRETLRQEAYFDTWLIRILINQCKTFYRRRPPEPAELTEDIPQVTSEETPLLEELMALPRKQRVTLELHYIEGYSVAETARILRLPEGTVKWRLKRGRELLKQSLNREEARA